LVKGQEGLLFLTPVAVTGRKLKGRVEKRRSVGRKSFFQQP